ncbi:hypothetical protein PAMP_000924 [Pampus punctatissimus]
MIHNIMAKTQLGNNVYAYCNLKDLSLNVVNISKVISYAETKPRIQIKAPELLPHSFVPEIWMPASNLLAIPTQKRIIGVVSYMSHSQFQVLFYGYELVRTFLFLRLDHRPDYSISIHVSLSGALFLLNSTFLLTEWGATVKPDWVCMFVAALMHYSLLCCFTWMAIEALHLYLLLIKVFNTYYKHYLVKLSLAGWGMVEESTQESATESIFKATEEEVCWITDDSFFYSLNLVYFTLIFIFNSGILMAVASSICRMKQVFRSNLKASAGAQGKTSVMFTTSCRSVLTVLGLTCLMGTTWGLAFLGSGYTNYPILYLFCILNSLQGFFIFLWICLSVNKHNKRKMDDRMTTPMKTSATKSD